MFPLKKESIRNGMCRMLKTRALKMAGVSARDCLRPGIPQ